MWSDHADRLTWLLLWDGPVLPWLSPLPLSCHWQDCLLDTYLGQCWWLKLRHQLAVNLCSVFLRGIAYFPFFFFPRQITVQTNYMIFKPLEWDILLMWTVVFQRHSALDSWLLNHACLLCCLVFFFSNFTQTRVIQEKGTCLACGHVCRAFLN